MSTKKIPEDDRRFFKWIFYGRHTASGPVFVNLGYTNEVISEVGPTVSLPLKVHEKTGVVFYPPIRNRKPLDRYTKLPVAFMSFETGELAKHTESVRIAISSGFGPKTRIDEVVHWDLWFPSSHAVSVYRSSRSGKSREAVLVKDNWSFTLGDVVDYLYDQTKDATKDRVEIMRNDILAGLLMIVSANPKAREVFTKRMQAAATRHELSKQMAMHPERVADIISELIPLQANDFNTLIQGMRLGQLSIWPQLHEKLVKITNNYLGEGPLGLLPTIAQSGHQLAPDNNAFNDRTPIQLQMLLNDHVLQWIVDRQKRYPEILGEMRKTADLMSDIEITYIQLLQEPLNAKRHALRAAISAAKKYRGQVDQRAIEAMKGVLEELAKVVETSITAGSGVGIEKLQLPKQERKALPKGKK